MRVSGGFLKNRSLSSPKKGGGTRPTSEKLRQALFNIIGPETEGLFFLDLFAGSGSMGIEALSRGFFHVTFVEKDQLALKCLKDNVNNLNLNAQATIMPLDALFSLKKLEKRETGFDYIYIDPPYKDVKLRETVLVCLAKSAILLRPKGCIFVEGDSRANLPQLEGLKLEKKRRFGSSLLYQFKRP